MNKKDQEMAAESIRARYTMETAAEGELDKLIRLDTKIRRPVNVFSYVFGSIASIVMGAGMSLVMTDIGQQVFGWQNSIVPGIVLGVIGLAAALINAFNSFDLEKVILTGEVASVPQPLLDRLNPIVTARILSRSSIHSTPITASNISASVRTGAMAMLYDYFQDRR